MRIGVHKSDRGDVKGVPQLLDQKSGVQVGHSLPLKARLQ